MVSVEQKWKKILISLIFFLIFHLIFHFSFILKAEIHRNILFMTSLCSNNGLTEGRPAVVIWLIDWLIDWLIEFPIKKLKEFENESIDHSILCILRIYSFRCLKSIIFGIDIYTINLKK